MAGHSTNKAQNALANLTGVECPEPVEGLSFVYILLCLDGSFYVGSTLDIPRRLQQHLAGRGAKHSSDKKATRLIYVEDPLPQLAAIRRERQLKGWSRAKKLALISRDLLALKKLSRPRTSA
jgi:predicted GIY-YIG superfamily endonuclease